MVCWQVGEKLGRYEVEKKKAVEMEDYDLAMEKKVSSEQIALTAMQAFVMVLKFPFNSENSFSLILSPANQCMFN